VSPIETVPNTQVIVLPLTVPAGPDTNDTVEAIKPVGKTSVIVTATAELPVTCNVKSYRTVSPAFGFVGRPVFTKLITAMGVGVKVKVGVDVSVTVAVQVAVDVAVGENVCVGVSVAVNVAVGVDVFVGVSVHVGVNCNVSVFVSVGVSVNVKVNVGV
jgi:hypothetical protein